MKFVTRYFLLMVTIMQVFIACSSSQKENDPPVNNDGQNKSYSLDDYFTVNNQLDKQVDSIVGQLSPGQLAGQMIVQAVGRLGKPDTLVERLIREKKIGGVLLLNGTVDSFKQKVRHFDSTTLASNALPLIYSADAEPSLINRKIDGTEKVPPTIELSTLAKNERIAEIIAKELVDIGILHNYAPVVDVSPDNQAIKSRSYGYDQDSVQLLAGGFIKTMQENGIAATAKHFPGHGLVQGDSHSKLVYIDGVMQELDIYKPLINDGVISNMVGHIAVRNNQQYNTDGLPASCARNIVTGLLKKQMGFKGLVITDAMNMGALRSIPNADLMAVKAGNDLILMPINEDKLIEDIVKLVQEDPAFGNQIKDSVKKIIRLKICLGLI